jgi:4a-hydroxytetrahydrobiopterin dehydratase
MNEWNNHNNKLEKLFVFPDFKIALEFVHRVGDLAEGMQHHPNIVIQNYNEVLISTTTHDAGDIVTNKDIELTKEIDVLLNNEF